MNVPATHIYHWCRRRGTKILLPDQRSMGRVPECALYGSGNRIESCARRWTIGKASAAKCRLFYQKLTHHPRTKQD
jgi:hypothetical protein